MTTVDREEWHRTNPSTAFRQIANGEGESIADCPSYLDGPTLEEALANAEMITTRAFHPDATPPPFVAKQASDGTWLVWGGPRNVIVAMVRRRPDSAAIAERIVARCAAATGRASDPDPAGVLFEAPRNAEGWTPPSTADA